MQNTEVRPLLWALTLLNLSWAPPLASAYYDPGVQRWINRDPMDEHGFNLIYRGFILSRWACLDAEDNLLADLHCYSFARNCPTAYVDPDGRDIQSICDTCYVTPAMARAIYDYQAAVQKLNKKYGGDWPDSIREYMDRWQKELLGKFGTCVAKPIAKTVPGTSVKGPVVKPKRP